MSSVHDTITEALATHYRLDPVNASSRWHCNCDWASAVTHQDHREHLAEAILAALTSGGFVVRKRVGL